MFQTSVCQDTASSSTNVMAASCYIDYFDKPNMSGSQKVLNLIVYHLAK